MKTAVVGAGLIGQAWAIVFARGGCTVHLWDADQQAQARALELIARQVRELESKGLLTDAANVIARIHGFPTLEQALQGVDYVQENLPEVVALKKEIFARLDEFCGPETILASSTSSIPASAFTEGLAGRHRCLVA